MIRKALGLLLWTAVSAGVALSSAGAADKVKLKMAEVVRSQFYMPMYVALSKGFVADEGLEVELITANGGDRAGALLLSGQTEFALAGPEVPIYIYNGESPDKPVIFCALTATDGLFLASRQKIDKFDWSMLNGKKIMGWRPRQHAPALSRICAEAARRRRRYHQEHRHQYRHARARRRLHGRRVRLCDLQRAEHVEDGEGRTGQYGGLDRQGGRPRRLHGVLRQEELDREERRARAEMDQRDRARPGLDEDRERKGDRGSDRAVFPRPQHRRQHRRREPLPHRRARRSGPTSTVVDHAGLAKVQEIMVVGGVLPADKKVAYDKIVANVYADKAQQKLASK